MLHSLVTVVAQNSQEVPEEGTGIGLILVGVLIAVLVALTVFAILRRISRDRGGSAPPDDPHPPGRVGH